MNPDLTRVRFIAIGNVQGVSYRWFTQHHAVELRITGFARNLPDGTVEIQAQGSSSAIIELKKRLLVGPPRATVLEVRETPMEPQPSESSFHVRQR